MARGENIARRVAGTFECALACGHTRPVVDAARRPFVGERLTCGDCGRLSRIHGARRVDIPRVGPDPSVVVDIARDGSSPPLHRKFTERQFQILRLLAAGMTQHQVADYLGLSVATVRSHIDRIYLRLKVHSKAEAVAVAAATGLL